MPKRTRRYLWIILVVIALLIPTAIAAAKELSSIVINGPGTGGDLTLDDPNDMRDLEGSGFFGDGTYSARIDPLENPGDGYTLVIYLTMEDGPVAWDEYVYYPNAVDGNVGVLHYLGPLQNDSGAVQGEWWVRIASGEDVFRGILAAHGVTIPEAAAAANLPAAPETEREQSAPPQEPAIVSAESEPAGESEAAPAIPAQPSDPAQPFPWPWIGGGAALVVLAAGAVWLARRSSRPAPAPQVEPSTAGQD